MSVTDDIDKVIKGLQIHCHDAMWDVIFGSCSQCPYNEHEDDPDARLRCRDALIFDALDLIKRIMCAEVWNNGRYETCPKSVG